MKYNKKWFLFIIGAALFLILSVGIYLFFFRKDKNSTLTLSEKQWIEQGKNKIIDLGIISDIPVFNYEGKGIFLDFIEALEGKTKLEFNKIPYTQTEEENTEYRFTITKQKEKNDISVYDDHFVLIGYENKQYKNIESIPSLTIGVVSTDLENINTYLKKDPRFSLKTFNTYNELFSSLSDPLHSLDAIAVPKNLYLGSILGSKFHILYQMTDYKLHYVLRLGKNKTLNNIIRKYYQKWKIESYEKAYAEHFSNNYFSFSGISDKEKTNFRSKQYIYGFINNSPFDFTHSGTLNGINKEYMKSFSKIADIEIKYNQYKNIELLEQDLNENKLDFIFANVSSKKYKIDTFNTVSQVDPKVVFLGTYNGISKMNSIYSLKGESVITLKGTKIESYLKDRGINVVSYETVDRLLHHRKSTDILALDEYTYLYLQNTDFKEYRILYSLSLEKDYGFIIRDIRENQIFENFFNFYISFVNNENHIDQAMQISFDEKNYFIIILNFLLYILAIIGALSIANIIVKFITQSKENNNIIRKEDKIKYIDQLTSLKNRNYLNDNIAQWDDSEVYPQSILIIDLNNIAYINDNYGHKEGDAVIASAANILIKNQLVNSEIIRTNGNEFLIYMVGYTEKQIVSYIRKLYREFRDLEHGFGAAIGYSMIVDAIKTVDDAINEATLDMRTAKEQNNN